MEHRGAWLAAACVAQYASSLKSNLYFLSFIFALKNIYYKVVELQKKKQRNLKKNTLFKKITKYQSEQAAAGAAVVLNE